MSDGAASSLNPDAGSHFITADPREVKAAVRASDETVRQMPYFIWRYGERGRRFGHSDSAWIVNLSKLSQEQVDHQVAWLGILLSARGMPRLLLERHLRVLHDALVEAVPERSADYAKLLVAAEKLRQARTSQVDEADVGRIVAAFEQAVGKEWEDQRAGIGELLVSAVADESAGIARAVASVTEWLTDRTRFSTEWVVAVEQAIAAAGAAVRHTPVASSAR